MATPQAWLDDQPRLQHYARPCPGRSFIFMFEDIDDQRFIGWFECEGCGWQRNRIEVQRHD